LRFRGGGKIKQKGEMIKGRAVYGRHPLKTQLASKERR
jgi:hypothetical protein